MKKLFFFIVLLHSLNLVAQPSNWKTFSATGCKGKTQSINGYLKDSLKPILLIWEGFDCPFCREEGAAGAISAQTYGKTIAYWNAVGRINGNSTCKDAEDWAKEYGTPANNFSFLDKSAEDNWSQPSPGQGRWYWVISQDKLTKEPKIIYSGNIIKDAEVVARRATKDFITENEAINSILESTKIYPNPAQEEIVLQLQLKSSAHVRVEILDLAGKIISNVLDGQVQSLEKSIDLSGFEKGMYVMKYSINDIPFSKLFSVN